MGTWIYHWRGIPSANSWWNEQTLKKNVWSYYQRSIGANFEKYYEKVKKIANYFTQCVYSQKLRKLDISLKDIKEKSREPDKSQKEKKSESNEKDIYQKYIKDKSRESDNIQKDTNNIKEYIYDFLYLNEKDALEIQYDAPPLIFKTKNGYEEINISDEGIKGKNLEYFLSNLKKIMSLDESIEEIEKMIGEYKVTEDNYKKMILILFRIFTNIPVILMGETGCGKTELIKKLMKM